MLAKSLKTRKNTFRDFSIMLAKKCLYREWMKYEDFMASIDSTSRNSVSAQLEPGM